MLVLVRACVPARALAHAAPSLCMRTSTPAQASLLHASGRSHAASAQYATRARLSEDYVRERNARALKRIEPILGKRGILGVMNDEQRAAALRRSLLKREDHVPAPENLSPLSSPVLGTRAVRILKEQLPTNVASTSEQLFEKCNLRLHGCDRDTLDAFCFFVKRLADDMQIPNGGIAHLPRRITKLVLLRSPHGNKKSRDTFLRFTHVRAIKFYNMTQRTADLFLSTVQSHLPAMCSLRALEFSYERLPENIVSGASDWVTFADVDAYFAKNPVAKEMAVLPEAQRPHVRTTTDFISPMRPPLHARLPEWPAPFDPTKGPYIEHDAELEQFQEAQAQAQSMEGLDAEEDLDPELEERLRAILGDDSPALGEATRAAGGAAAEGSAPAGAAGVEGGAEEAKPKPPHQHGRRESRFQKFGGQRRAPDANKGKNDKRGAAFKKMEDD